MYDIEKEAINLFTKLSERPLRLENHARWYYDLDTALKIGQVWLPLLQKDSTGTRPARPSTTDTLAGSSWEHVVRPYNKVDDGVGMYDALTSQFLSAKPTMRYLLSTALFEFRLNPKPILGTDWDNELRELDVIVDQLNQAAQGMTVEEFIDEIALHTIMSMVPRNDSFYQTVYGGLDSNAHSYRTAKDKLLRHTQAGKIKEYAILNAASLPHAAMSLAGKAPDLATSQAPPRQLAPPHDESFSLLNGHPNVAPHTRCFFCGGDHPQSACSLYKKGQQEAQRLVRSKKSHSISSRFVMRNFRRYPAEPGTFRPQYQARYAQAQCDLHLDDYDPFFDLDVEMAVGVSSSSSINASLSDVMTAGSGTGAHVMSISEYLSPTEAKGNLAE
ncbi:hypothetical protein FRC17_001595 [Serendipita sp. 399]|nr:hypothetical protein FRC17_001595 [Serendipita sp. 399]